MWVYVQFSSYLFVWFWFLPIPHFKWTKRGVVTLLVIRNARHLKDPALCQWSTVLKCCSHCQMNSAGYVRMEGNNETYAKKMHLRCINQRRIPMAIPSSFYQNWKRIEQTGKVIVKWRHAWILLTVCETHWALMFFADPWTSSTKSCIACSPMILRAWQSFEWVRFHANLTGVQMDQNPYF